LLPVFSDVWLTDVELGVNLTMNRPPKWRLQLKIQTDRYND
jgi:hypothetical protein